jgi:microcystin degradation protein MlrC
VIRIALLGLAHETNTFSSVTTDLAKFERDGILRGEEIIAAHATAHTSLSGFLAAGKDDPSIEVVPLIWAWANPSGAITKDAFNQLTTEMLSLLRNNGEWDAVFLAQHGAAVSEEFPDADGEIVRRVRELVGEDIPIGVTLDMHANVTSEVVRNATVIVGFQTNPHIDARERAEECASLILETVRGRIKPVMAFTQIPAVISILRQSTLEEPMSVIVNHALRTLSKEQILSVSVFEGYPYADVEAMGMSCLTISDGNYELAKATNQEIADEIWSHKSDFQGYACSAAEAVIQTCKDNRPNLLLDVGDNIGGGGPADSTFLLVAALEAKVSGFLMILHDPHVVDLCIASGLGAKVSVEIGAKKDGRHGKPVLVDGVVSLVSDGKYEEPTPTHGGFRFFDSGPTVVLEMANDMLLILTTKITLPASLEQIRSLGIRPEDRRVIVAKGTISPQAAYRPIAGKVILVNTPGDTSSDLQQFNYKQRRRPLHPFEAIS